LKNILQDKLVKLFIVAVRATQIPRDLPSPSPYHQGATGGSLLPMA